MFYRWKPINFFLTGLGIAALTACAPVAVKDIAADKQGYLEQNFAPQQLPEGLKKQLAGGGQASPRFGTMRLKLKATFEDAGKTPQTPSIVLTLKNAGGGLIQGMMEYSHNDIPYGIQYSLTYMGLIPLREQTVRFNQQVGGLTFEAKEVTQLGKDAIQPRENTEYVFEWTNGSSVQIANLSNIKLLCRSGTFYPANTVHPKLSANAIDLSCTREVNGIVRAKQKYVVLPAYGVALKSEHQSSANKETFKIEAVEFL
jgi:hypothetical protein